MVVSQAHFAISHLKSLGDAVNLGSRALLVLGLRLRELPLLALRRQARHHRPGQETQQQWQKHKKQPRAWLIIKILRDECRM